MDINGKDLYFVAVKVFLENEKGEFLITKDRFGDWDIPGGRLRPEDFDVSLEDIVARKLKEELGTAFVYKLGEPALHMRHERDEIVEDGKTEKARIFAVGYRAVFQSGNIELGENHEELAWVDPSTFDPAAYFSGGWLKGIKRYIAIQT